MSCMHEGKIMDYGFSIECKILKKRCVFVKPCEKRCSEEIHGIIHYLKALGTYEKVLNECK